MAIGTADILYKLSTGTATAGNTDAQTNVNNSLGKYISTTQITDASLNNLFDDISGDENAASTVDYRCFFVHNAHATLPWTTCYLWMSAETAGGANAAINYDSAGAKPLGTTGTQSGTITTEITAPSGTGTAWGSPTTKATGFLLGTIAAGSVHAIWLRRTAANSTALDSDDVSVRIEGDTSA